jgi:acetolactate synthase-1/2/3 large subunit
MGLRDAYFRAKAEPTKEDIIMATTQRAADFLAQRLYEAGCRYAFGMPGGEVLTLVDALEKAGIQMVLAKHENAAGFMAEGVYHRTGAPAILIATVGPGALNGINVVGNALQDQVPMIVLTGCVEATEALTYTHQILDHQKVYEELTKATFRMTVEGADIVTDKALAIATEGRPGPVHIDVPIAAANTQVTIDKLRRRPAAVPVMPAPGPDLERARGWIGGAKRPVIIAGVDAMNDGSGAGILAVAEQIGAPIITSYKAKGIVPETHDLCLGGAGLSPLADKTLLPIIEAADLIICAGYDPIEMRTGWREIWDPAQVNVIDISAVPNHHYMHQATINVVGHTGATLALMAEGVDGADAWANGAIARAKADLAAAFPRDDAWGPAAVIDTCQQVLPDNVVATVDSGAHRILLSQMWQCGEQQTLLQSTALCTMGCAVPLAIGAKFADAERVVVSFSGDAGFLMVAGEMATAAELNLPVIFVVFVDASLSLIEKKQRERQLTNKFVDFARHDFAAIGAAFGGNGVTVRSRAELETALNDAMVAERFTVIGAEIDAMAYDGRI